MQHISASYEQIFDNIFQGRSRAVVFFQLKFCRILLSLCSQTIGKYKQRIGGGACHTRLRSHRYQCESGTVQVPVLYFNGGTAAIHIHMSTN